MRYVVGGQQQVWRPARLEMRIDSVALFVFLVIVGVDEVCLGMFLQQFDHLEEGIRRQLVALLQESYKLTLSQREGRIQQTGYARASLQVRYLYPIVEARVAIEKRPHALLGEVATNAQLPVRVALAYHGVQPPLQPRPLQINNRQQDAYEWPISEVRCFIPQTHQVARSEAIALNQRGILIVYVATTDVTNRGVVMG